MILARKNPNGFAPVDEVSWKYIFTVLSHIVLILYNKHVVIVIIEDI